MSDDKFDNELSSLYQQRKTHIQPPEFVAASITKSITPQRSPWHILALLLSGGVASFGIMALISHFAKSPVHGVDAQYKQHSVRVVEVVEIATPETTLPPITPPLPPTPERTSPKHSENSRISQESVPLAKAKLSLNIAVSQVVKIPEIKQTSLAIMPVHRVMPEYPKAELYARNSGTVKLKYRISDQGKVIDITAPARNGNRSFERSAKQALAQWRYPERSGNDQWLEIEFEFNLAL